MHARMIRGKKGVDNVCGRDGACEKDEGGRGEDRSLQLRGRMQEGRGRRRGGQMSAVERVHVRRMRGD